MCADFHHGGPPGRRKGADRVRRARAPNHVEPGRLAAGDCIWDGVDGDELVSAHLMPDQRTLQNVRREIERIGGVGAWAGQ
jgi:hypothetical protein